MGELRESKKLLHGCERVQFHYPHKLIRSVLSILHHTTPSFVHFRFFVYVEVDGGIKSKFSTFLFYPEHKTNKPHTFCYSLKTPANIFTIRLYMFFSFPVPRPCNDQRALSFEPYLVTPHLLNLISHEKASSKTARSSSQEKDITSKEIRIDWIFLQN